MSNQQVKVTVETLDLLCELATQSLTRGYLSRCLPLSVETLNLLCEVALKLLTRGYNANAAELLRVVAKHPNLPYAKLQDFLNNPPCNDALWGALLNPQLSAAELDEWAKKPIMPTDYCIGSHTGWALEAICKNDNTSAETLKYIAERPDFVTAIATCHQVNSWPDHLQALCEALLENPKTPSEVVFFINRIYASTYGYDNNNRCVPADVKNPLL